MENFRALVDRLNSLGNKEIVVSLKKSLKFNEKSRKIIARKVDQISLNLADCKNAVDTNSQIPYNQYTLKLHKSLATFADIIDCKKSINLKALSKLLEDTIFNSEQFIFDLENPIRKIYINSYKTHF